MGAPGDSTSFSADHGAAAPSAQALFVSIVHEAGDWRDFPEVEAAVEASARALSLHPRCRKAQGAEAAVVLADDARVRELNAGFRGKDAPTNVLSFPFQPPPGAPEEVEYLGDVVLAAGTIRREADERGIAPVAHLQHLVVHGLLHLLGFDHMHDEEARDMEGLETEILASLGIADPYAD